MEKNTEGLTFPYGIPKKMKNIEKLIRHFLSIVKRKYRKKFNIFCRGGGGKKKVKGIERVLNFLLAECCAQICAA